MSIGDNETGSNGSAIGQFSEAVRVEHDKKRDALAQHSRESEQLRQAYKKEIQELHTQRQHLIMQAANYAGNLGLIYRPRTNTFARVLIPNDLEPELQLLPPELFELVRSEEPKESPISEILDIEGRNVQLDAAEAPHLHNENNDPITPPNKPLSSQNQTLDSDDLTQLLAKIPELSLPPRPERPKLAVPPLPPAPAAIDKDWKRVTNVKSGFAWFFSLFVGCFVGFGLRSLVGASTRTIEGQVLSWIVFAAGIGAIAGIKLLFDQIGYELGRGKVLGNSSIWKRILLYSVALLLVCAEATLGAQALVVYTSKVSFGGQSGLSFQTAILLSFAVSTATLIFSGLVGYQKGCRSVTEQDIHDRRYEIERDHIKKLQETELQDYENRLREHEDLVSRLTRERADVIERVQRHYEATKARKAEIEAAEHELRAKAIAQQAEIIATMHQHNKDMIELKTQAQKAAVEAVQARRAKMIQVFDEASQELEERIGDVSIRKMPDFQGLLKCIAVIEGIEIRIEELEKKSTNEQISRGHLTATVL